MTPREANALTALGLAGLLASVALTAPRWAALLRSPASTVEAEEATGEETPRAAPDAAAAERRISVRLYFEAPDREGLLPEEREVAFSPDLAVQLRIVVEELAKGSTSGLLAALPPGTQVLEVFVQAKGVAFVDLSPEAVSGLVGGSRAELLTVYSVVDTIVTNFPAVSRVQILVGDKPVTSLGGHVDLSRPLPSDMTLVALPTPVPPPAEPSVAAPAPPPGGGRT
ncbi:MAG TPA: GerMN domain-containing protein [Vicinamibacteria bacterium]|nr:GerMN domain-containing protein [Vicinamibacteria bacterium]